MKYLYIMSILFIVLGLIIKLTKKDENNEISCNIINSPMTKTEIFFYNILKEITNKYNLIVFPQIQLQKIFKTNTIKDFNKIKSKSIDFAILDNNYNYKIFIELDDYTHNYNKRINRDIFVNNLFKSNNLQLLRIKVKEKYNIDELENIIKSVI